MCPFTGSNTEKWASVLRGSDFDFARREIVAAFVMMKQQGEREGGAYYLSPDLASAWQAFAANSCANTAAALLDIAPMFARYFEACKPAGPFNDEQKEKFVEAISAMLQVQLIAAGDRSIENAAGKVNARALGYIYGFIDAALRTIGHDMSDKSIGIPITFHVLRRILPGREERYVQYLVDRMGTDQQVTLAAVTGGQQYLDFNNGKLAAPMGLTKCLLADE
jgi:hypothetical protein